MLWVMAGGGTGGHIYPALALAAAVKTILPDVQIWFIGATQGLEQKIIPKHGYPLLTVSSRPFPRKLLSPTSFLSGSMMLYGIVQALKHLRGLRPRVVIGTGGYASVCALIAGKIVGAKVVLFEANSIPGRTNKLLAKIADWVATGFPEAVNFFPKGKATYTGVPTRSEVRDMDRTTARKTLGLTESELCLLVFGGSRGAQRINEALWDALPKLLLRPCLRIVHICGSQWEQEAKRIREALPEDVKGRYQPFGYREDMPVILHSADLAVSRAGASSIAELLVAGVPSILVPYPFAVYDHQRFNALSLVRRGAAKMVLNAELSGERLWREVFELLDRPENLRRMSEAALSVAKPFAAEEIVKRTLSLL
ncbi:MAG: undecaprenyldiphospho-muramoylpentapeptide beta-N-acetylglucosaminyltransferase [Armatimonadetes bacterium]|nr:undecaprenyldiphospho-muramoylpentapeptide beta-N-acetylglucosaminyltransferase [Armatimonadota bacterium]